MRSLSLLLIAAAALGACSTTPGPVRRSAEAEAQLQTLLAGHVPGQARSCLSNFRTDRMTVIDSNTVLFKDGGTVYRTELAPGCSRLGDPGYAMLTRQYGGGSLCQGELAQVIDTANGFVVGSCSFGAFVPYAKVNG